MQKVATFRLASRLQSQIIFHFNITVESGPNLIFANYSKRVFSLALGPVVVLLLAGGLTLNVVLAVVVFDGEGHTPGGVERSLSLHRLPGHRTLVSTSGSQGSVQGGRRVETSCAVSHGQARVVHRPSGDRRVRSIVTEGAEDVGVIDSADFRWRKILEVRDRVGGPRPQSGGLDDNDVPGGVSGLAQVASAS